MREVASFWRKMKTGSIAILAIGLFAIPFIVAIYIFLYVANLIDPVELE